MVEKEYKQLVEILSKGAEGLKDVNLEDILSRAVLFFERLRKEFPNASKEEREEMTHMMTTLHEMLQEVSKKVATETGLTEEDLANFASNPSNYTPEQWQLVQSTKQQLYDSARKFTSAIESEAPTPAEGAPPPKKTAKKKSAPRGARRPRRKGWTKT